MATRIINGKAVLGLLMAAAFFSGCATAPVLRGAPGEPYPPAYLAAGEIYHVPTGIKLTADGLLEMVSGARIIYVGEMHSNMEAHRVQLQVLKEMNERFPGRMAMGMEMFRVNQQEAINRWLKGELAEPEFIKESGWFDNWRSDFGYYRDILVYCRDNGVDVVALNPTQELQGQVRKHGQAAAEPASDSNMPDIDDNDIYWRESIKAIYAGHAKTEGMLNAFYRVQALWEESMAQRIADYLTAAGHEDKKMVVITGGWHVQYGFGVPKKVLRRLAAPYAVVMPEEISIPEEKKAQLTMDVSLPDLPLLKADYLWFVDYRDLESERVRLGVRMISRDAQVVVDSVEPGSPAEKAGVKAGDVIVSMDGQTVDGMGVVFYLVNAKRDGDASTLVIKRDGENLTLPVKFFRPAPPAK